MNRKLLFGNGFIRVNLRHCSASFGYMKLCYCVIQRLTVQQVFYRVWYRNCQCCQENISIIHLLLQFFMGVVLSTLKSQCALLYKNIIENFYFDDYKMTFLIVPVTFSFNLFELVII